MLLDEGLDRVRGNVDPSSAPKGGHGAKGEASNAPGRKKLEQSTKQHFLLLNY